MFIDKHYSLKTLINCFCDEMGPFKTDFYPHLKANEANVSSRFGR